ncbi:hypothetical protein CBS101457_003322 [Exobasidium rhododendri]|nr:hypothetical protein CBS101457_003322 [Exobasidium rhododendri]
MVESVFSIYYAYLARRVQQRGPAPMYGRRFLRRVFSRALESGMDDDDGVYNGKGNAENVNGNHDIRKRRNRDYEGAKLASPSLATKRLRAASFVPRFVDKEPLHRDDPRAKSFAKQQAMWFPGSQVEDLTRKDIERWLSWSLYGAELSDIERELHETKPREEASFGSSNNATSPAETKMEQQPLTTEPPLPPSSPTPASQGSFARRMNSVESDEEEDDGDSDTIDYEKEDRQGARAVDGEWDADPIQGSRLEFIYYCRELIEARQGFAYDESPPNWTPVPCMRLTLDPVKVTSRPLLLYLAVNAVSMVTLLHAQWDGFSLERQGRIKYLIYRPPNWSKEKAKEHPSLYRPIVFLHGLGIGLGQYGSLIRYLRKTPLTRTHPLLIPLQPHISQAIFDPSNHLQPFQHHEFTALFRRVFRREGWTQSGVTVLSHSNGTLLHSWLLKSAGEFIKRSCFVDPVCLQLWVPHIVGNFLYIRPKTGVMKLISYFVASELGTANMLFRHFDWSSCLLWPQDDVPNLRDPHACQFYLAEEDSIVNGPETRKYLRQAGLKEASDARPKGQQPSLHYIPQAAHGEVLMAGGDLMKGIVDWLDEPDP